jgi:hypothetical protein
MAFVDRYTVSYVFPSASAEGPFTLRLKLSMERPRDLPDDDPWTLSLTITATPAWASYTLRPLVDRIRWHARWPILLSVATALHPRLGADSPLRWLDGNLTKLILSHL